MKTAEEFLKEKYHSQFISPDLLVSKKMLIENIEEYANQYKPDQPQSREELRSEYRVHLRNRCLMAFEELLFNHNADAVTLPEAQLKVIRKLIKDLQP